MQDTIDHHIRYGHYKIIKFIYERLDVMHIDDQYMELPCDNNINFFKYMFEEMDTPVSYGNYYIRNFIPSHNNYDYKTCSYILNTAKVKYTTIFDVILVLHASYITFRYIIEIGQVTNNAIARNLLSIPFVRTDINIYLTCIGYHQLYSEYSTPKYAIYDIDI